MVQFMELDFFPMAPSTFCNPLSIPNYPVGRLCRSAKNGDSTEGSLQWMSAVKEQFRELADPSVLWHDNKWYLYPSVDMAWVSSDGGATWQHHPLNIRDIGYAPTIEKHKGKFFILASNSELYRSDSPLGPFETLGRIQFPPGVNYPEEVDPMLFSDDDDRLYYYWGCTERDGIWAVELDSDSPVRIVGQPVQVIPFCPDKHPWECLGSWNQDPNVGWLEGAWMLKRNQRYYLIYSAAGTSNKTYAKGCYIGDSPLGPFQPQKKNPILLSTSGLITGTAHGSFVAGPDNSLWTFYTVRAVCAHGYERRIAMDRAAFDEAGELYVPEVTSIPQWVTLSAKEMGSKPGWLPLNMGKRTVGSSSAPNLTGYYAVDETMHTWWQPASDDLTPTLTSHFGARATVHAVRLIWRDIGLDTNRGVLPGPFCYRVELETEKGIWSTVLDRTNSSEDYLIDYREIEPTSAMAARLVITGWPEGMTPGVVGFTLFGFIPKIAPR